MACPACGATCDDPGRYCPVCGHDSTSTPAAAVPALSQSAGSDRAGMQPLQPGTLLSGRYRIQRVLGSGAFGRVYLAEDSSDTSSGPLAIKELLDAQFTTADEKRDAISWFKREVSTLLNLDHHSIPAIHGYWTAARSCGPFYLAMDYIPGKTLARTLQEAGGPLPWQQVVEWGLALCEVLAYLHERRPPFIFRDLKLPNVLIDSRTNAPALIDFGIARQIASGGGTAIGTWGYVPMEQVLGKSGPSSDIYALGATLHALLTGRNPETEYLRLHRAGQDVESILRALFPPAHTLAPAVPPMLAQVVGQATAFAAADRFPDALAMADALLHALAPSNAIVPYVGAQAVNSAPPASTEGTTSARQVQTPISTPSVEASSLADALTLWERPSTATNAITVAPDGSGDYQNLEEALRQAQPGAEIYLCPGVHLLEQPLRIRQAVAMIGAGMDQTTLVCAGEEYVVRFAGSGLFTVRDLTFAHEGREWATVVEVADGEVAFQNCRFLGAVWGHEADCGGDGVWLHGEAHGAIIDCEALDNMGNGILVSEHAAPTLEGATCRENKGSGMAFLDSAAGSAQGSACDDNGQDGIYVGQRARPALEKNLCRRNGGAGIAYFSDAAGVARLNICTGNGAAGISIAATASPTLEENMCHGNQRGDLDDQRKRRWWA